MDVTGGEQKVKVTSAQTDLRDGRITIDGRDVFGDLLVPANLEETARKQESFTSALPEEDTKPGHVIPATLVTMAGSS